FLFLLTLSVAMLAALGADALRRELSPAAGGEDDAAPGRRGASPQTSPGSRVPSQRAARDSERSEAERALSPAVLSVRGHRGRSCGAPP
ncbi:MAG TPA: hypothetical protein VHN78_16185, partial [Chloroflexota bacterium]|nr:hypothetical protein [Chloroflexota bacterium]